MVATAGQFMGGTAGPYADPTEASPELFQGLVNFLAAGGKFEEYLARTFPQTAFADKKMTRDAAKKFIEGMSSTQRKAVLPKAASRVAGMGTRTLPLLQGTLQTLGGDPIGGVGTAVGGYGGAIAGAKLGSVLGPKGALIGGLIGGTVGGNIGQGLTRAVTGIDVNNPLTGPDISLPIGDGIPLTQYAKTKKTLKRAMELEKMRYDQLLPMIEKAKDRQFQRDLVSGQMQMAGQLLGNIYPR